MELVKITESEWWEYYAFDNNLENVFIDNLINMFAKNDRIYDSRTETECDQVGTSTLIITRESRRHHKHRCERKTGNRTCV